MTVAPGLKFGQLKNERSYPALVCLAVCLAAALLTPWPAALASETKTDIENIYQDIEYCRKASAHTRIEAFLKTHPNDADVLSMKARYFLLDDKFKEAEPLYRRACALSPRDSRAFAGLSFCQINDKDYKGAFESASRADAVYEVNAIHVLPDLGLLKNLNQLCLKFGRRQEAAHYQQKIKEYEAANLARTFREQGVLEKSLELLDPLIKADPTCAYALLLRGVVYNNRSEHVKAIKDFDAAIALQPTMANAYYFRGDSYFDMGNKAKALESWKQLLKVHPVSYPGLVCWGYTAMTGRFREHFEPNDEAIVNHADVYYLCGVAESDLRQYEQAIKDYSQCIALDKGEYKAYFERAAMNGRLNRESQVLADLDQAIKLNGKYIEALLERAKFYEKKHDTARAMADYGRVIAVNPSDFGSYILRADLALRNKSYDQALSDYSQAIKLSPTDDDPLMGRAKTYTAMGRYDEAIADYKKAMRLNPQDKGVVIDAISHVEKLKKNPALSVR